MKRGKVWWAYPLFYSTVTVVGFATIVAAVGWPAAIGIFLFVWGYGMQRSDRL